MGTLNLQTSFSLQGVGQGDILLMMVRHAKIYDPHDIQHSVAYSTDDAMQHFLTKLLETSNIPDLTDCVLYHEDLLLDLASWFQDCNLPHEPTLYLRFPCGLDAPPTMRPGNPESAEGAEDPGESPIFPQVNYSPPTDNPPETQKEPQGTRNTKVDWGMAFSAIPSQTLVQDTSGKTHSLLFHPQDSVTENLKRHSTQLYLPPPEDLYILSGSHIIQTDLTWVLNGFPREPHLRILLRCRGGMRN